MLALCCSIVVLSLAEDPPVDVPFSPGVTIHFASLEEGKAEISRPDDFTKSMSKLDVQIRLRSDKDLTPDDYIRFVTPHVTEWSNDERAKLTRILGKIRDRLKTLDLAPPFPAKILFVRTTGLEEAQAAYTRSQAIFLPASKVGAGESGLEKLVAHELFHVLTRQAPELRERLYAIVGYHPCPSVELPADWRDRKLTNPDAPHLDTAIELTLDGKPVQAVSLLFSRDEKYEPKEKDSLFRYLEFRLLVIDIEQGKSRARLVDGKPLLLDPHSSADFQKKIGRNTGYIIHPDEILADNFMHLIAGTPGLPNPEIVAKLKEELAKDIKKTEPTR